MEYKHPNKTHRKVSLYKGQLFDYSKAAKMDDIYSKEFIQSLNLPRAALNVAFSKGTRVKRQFIAKVFRDFLSLVMDDCIENNNKFHSPNRIPFALYIREKPAAEIRRIVKNKTYKNTDFIESDFKVYEFCCSATSYIKNRPIRVGYERYKKIQEKVNNGMRYYTK